MMKLRGTRLRGFRTRTAASCGGRSPGSASLFLASSLRLMVLVPFARWLEYFVDSRRLFTQGGVPAGAAQPADKLHCRRVTGDSGLVSGFASGRPASSLLQRQRAAPDALLTVRPPATPPPRR